MKLIKKLSYLLLMTLLISSSICCEKNEEEGRPKVPVKHVIPLGGNAFTFNEIDSYNDLKITTNGIEGWYQQNSKIYIYFNVTSQSSAELSISAKRTIQNGFPSGNDILKVTLNNESTEVIIDGSNTSYDEYLVGTFPLHKGFNKIEIEGVSKQMFSFPNLKDLIILPNVVQDIKFFKEIADFTEGRRGTSPNLRYNIPTNDNISYYYNEVSVPENYDNIYSFYMGVGFMNGYFGIQTNDNNNKKNVIFSVWSSFTNQDHGSVPNSKKVYAERVGDGVIVENFGNEGSGIKTYKSYNWTPNKTYKFLVKGEPISDNKTAYTAWFLPPDKEQWILMSRLIKPETNSYLTDFHSFLENYSPTSGYLTRKAEYRNQWVYSSNKSSWLKVRGATFTGGSQKIFNIRPDANSENITNGYSLQNGGFFELNNTFQKALTNNDNTQNPPKIDFSKLP